MSTTTMSSVTASVFILAVFFGFGFTYADSETHNVAMKFGNFFGGFSMAESKPYNSPSGQSVKLLSIAAPGESTGELFEVPATQDTSSLSFSDGIKSIGNTIFSVSNEALVIVSGDQCFLKKKTGEAEDISTTEKCKTILSQKTSSSGGLSFGGMNFGTMNYGGMDFGSPSSPTTSTTTSTSTTTDSETHTVFQKFSNFFGGFSMAESKPYNAPSGLRVKLLSITAPGESTGELFEVPASQDTSSLSVSNGKKRIGDSIFSVDNNALVVMSGDQCFLKKKTGEAEDITTTEKCKTILSEKKSNSGAMNFGGMNFGGMNLGSSSKPTTATNNNNNKRKRRNRSRSKNTSD